MRKQVPLLIFFLLTSCLAGYSQLEYVNPDTTENQNLKGDFVISASPNILFNTPNGTQFAGGLKIKAFLSKRFSVESDLVVGRNYVHAGPGLIGIPVALIVIGSENLIGTESVGEFLFYLGCVILSAEHIAYNIPLKQNIYIAPYVSLLRLKSAYVNGSELNPAYAGDQLSFAAGIEVEKYFGRFVISPYAEFNVGYSDHLPGFNIGAYLGILFPGKNH